MDNKFTRLDSYGRVVCVPAEAAEPNFKEPEAPWGGACETWARAERVKRLVDIVIMLTDRMKRAENKNATLHLANIAITEALSELSVKLYKVYDLVFDHEMGDADPEIPEPRERVCESCKWGVKEEINRDEVWCHYDPEGMGRPREYWCSRWHSND